jgi:hypothetical protein
MRVHVTHTYVISMASRHNRIAIDGCHDGIAMVGVCAHVAMYYGAYVSMNEYPICHFYDGCHACGGGLL